MNWQIIVATRILVANVLYPIFWKKLADENEKTKNQFFFFGCCVILSLMLLAGKIIILGRKENLNLVLLFIFFLGIINSAALFANIRATSLSLCKTSIFNIADDVIALLLGYVFMNETSYLNPGIVYGSLLSLSAFLLFYRQKERKLNFILFKWVAVYSLIWGIIIFCFRCFAFSGVPFIEFSLCWYFGSFIGAGIFLMFSRNFKNSFSVNLPSLLKILTVAFFAWLSLLLTYSTLAKAPLVITVPIFLISEMCCGTIIGLLYFKERHMLLFREKFALMLGAIGSIIIAFNF